MRGRLIAESMRVGAAAALDGVELDAVYRYERGDAAGRERAAEHGRRVGVPEHQLDWE